MRIASTRTCACGRHYDAESWAALPLAARLSAEQVSFLVDPWPPHVVVEVRVCVLCRRKMARLENLVQAEPGKQEAIAA
jgi:hypothetical protein